MKEWPAALQLLAVGFYVALSLVIPAGIGVLLDKKAAHAFPLFTLIGLGLGTIVMIYGVYRMVKPFMEEARREGEGDKLRGPAKILARLTSSKQKGNEEQK